jgi:hypothetical protein
VEEAGPFVPKGSGDEGESLMMFDAASCHAERRRISPGCEYYDCPPVVLIGDGALPPNTAARRRRGGTCSKLGKLFELF